MNLSGSRIIVTGGSLGIGRKTAEVLIEAGAKVAITGRDEARVSAAAEEIGALPVCADVGLEADVEKTYATVLEAFGGLDCLVNNAGIGAFDELIDLKKEDFEKVWQVNVLGAAMMAQKAAQVFVKQNSGAIVNIASTAGRKGFAKGSIYCASKFALRGMTECWQAELRKHNVRVILVNPSEVPTAFANAERKERPEEANKLTTMEIAHSIKAALEMDDRGFIPELTVFATNPW